jgi:peptidoglycan-N-acetylglucosamine deacetylase
MESVPSSTPIAVAAVAAATGALAYAALYPQAQIFGKVLIAPPRPDEIALTYDDGPNPAATERLLEVLAHHQTRATFFLIGRFVRQCPALTRAIAGAGHLIGNHTMTHPWLAWQSPQRIREEIHGCNHALEDALGAPVRYFRAPHGAVRPYVLRVAREVDLTPVQWNVTAHDWSSESAETIRARATCFITRNQQSGRASNVLLHDGGHAALNADRLATVAATDLLLTRYKSTVKFVTPADWL